MQVKSGKFWVFSTIIVLVVFTKVLLMPFGDLDEIWVYNVSRGITEGLIPYKDIEMVFMPLYNMLFALPLLIVRNLFVYRLTSAVLLSAVSIVLMLTISKDTSLWYGFPASLSVIVLYDTATYNFLFLLFTLFIFNSNRKANSNSRNITLGVLAALCALTRQTSGVIIIIAELVYLLFEDRFKSSGDDESPSRAKTILAFIAGIAAPCLVFLVYLLVTDSFGAFWDHCFFALFAFGQGNSGFDPSANLPLTVSFAGIICDLLLLSKNRNKDQFSHILLAVALLTIAVPIVDLHHTIMAEAFCIIPIARTLRFYLAKYMRKVFSIILSVVFISQSVFVTVLAIQNGVYFSDKYNELELIPLTGVADDYYQIVVRNNEYKALGKKVIMFSSSSALVSILSNECNYPYDLFQTGSLGTTDPVEYAIEACNDPTNIILMPADYPAENFENPEGIYEYVISHCIAVDHYGHFTYYMPNP